MEMENLEGAFSLLGDYWDRSTVDGVGTALCTVHSCWARDRSKVVPAPGGGFISVSAVVIGSDVGKIIRYTANGDTVRRLRAFVGNQASSMIHRCTEQATKNERRLVLVLCFWRVCHQGRGCFPPWVALDCSTQAIPVGDDAACP